MYALCCRSRFLTNQDLDKEGIKEEGGNVGFEYIGLLDWEERAGMGEVRERGRERGGMDREGWGGKRRGEERRGEKRRGEKGREEKRRERIILRCNLFGKRSLHGLNWMDGGSDVRGEESDKEMG